MIYAQTPSEGAAKQFCLLYEKLFKKKRSTGVFCRKNVNEYLLRNLFRMAAAIVPAYHYHHHIITTIINDTSAEKTNFFGFWRKKNASMYLPTAYIIMH